jgi:zinc protease
MTIIVGLSVVGGTILAGDQLDRTMRPKGKPAPVIHLPEIQKASLKNGLQIWLVESHKLPLVALNLVVQGGADQDPLTMPGIATMTADMLDEGTPTRTTLRIADELDALGATLRANASLDGSFVFLQTLSKNLQKALVIYSDVLSHPTFPEKEFARLKKQRIAMLVQQHDQPPAIATNAFNYILYGEDHPYGNNTSGTEKSLGAMTSNNLVQFYQSYYRPNNATLIVVGDTKLSEIVPILEKGLTDWQPAQVPSFPISQPPPLGQRKIYLIDKPGSSQSEMRIGYPALARSTPDYFAVSVMNRMLGGQFTSRINLNLRERHGYTYGATSNFRFLKGVGPFVAGGGIVTEKTDSAIVECIHEIDLMREKGMTADELAYSKKGALGNFALTFETPMQIAGALQNIVLYGLPEDYYNNYLKHIDAVNLDDVQRVAAKYLDASKMAIVVVGDLAKIKDGITALKLGDVELCDVDGKKLP